MSPKVAKVSKATIGVTDIIVILCATNFANTHEHIREEEKHFCQTNDSDSGFP
jgi:hypothetical protein